MNYPILLLLVFLLNACQQSEITIDSQSIIANYDTGNISLQNLEDYIINLPANKRWVEKGQEKWITGILNKIIVERKLYQEAMLIAANEQPQYKNQAHNIERYAYSQQYLASFTTDDYMSEDNILQFYNEHIERYVLPEKRYVYHIYKDKGTNSKAQQEIESLRQRSLNGENFKLLAEQYSDSETRHNKGLLGLMKKGDKSKDFDGVVFALEKNKVSEVINTASGFHLFFVSDILQAKNYQYAQVKNIIKKELLENYRVENLKEKALILPTPEPFELLTLEDLSNINLVNNPRKIILKVATYELTIGQFKQELNEFKKLSKNKLTKDFPEKLLETIAYSEIIYQHMKSNSIKLVQQPQLDKQLKDLLVSEYTKQRMLAYLNQNNELIKEYFNTNSMRFATPVKVNLQRLIIMKKQENLMPVLEKSIKKLDSNELSFEQLAKTYSGKIQYLGLKNSSQLFNVDPQILKYAFVLDEGEYSPPYTNDKFYSVLKLVKREDSVKQSLAVVREQVISEYIKIHSAQIYSEISKEMLKDVVIDTDVLNSFVANQGI